jgi:chitin disaccharide deacetylase
MSLIINADDWGRDRENTDRALECVLSRSVSSVSAMVFMEDSERAAAIAENHDVDAGLHLNLTTPFSAPSTAGRLVEHQSKLSDYLRRHRFAPVLYNPTLIRAFDYVVSAQCDEFARLYGRKPERVDGHHHMHLCSNVVLGGLLPRDAIVRRSFSFQSGERPVLNRVYRSVVDQMLARRHRITDLFYSLPPFAPAGRVQRIIALARKFTVEVETHPVNQEEYEFLTGGAMFRCAGDVPIETAYIVPLRRGHAST